MRFALGLLLVLSAGCVSSTEPLLPAAGVTAEVFEREFEALGYDVAFVQIERNQTFGAVGRTFRAVRAGQRAARRPATVVVFEFGSVQEATQRVEAALPFVDSDHVYQRGAMVVLGPVALRRDLSRLLGPPLGADA